MKKRLSKKEFFELFKIENLNNYIDIYNKNIKGN